MVVLTVVQILTVQKKKRDLMLKRMDEEFPKDLGVRWTVPKGGIFIWVELPGHIDTQQVMEEAMDKYGIGIVPGHGFFTDDSIRRYYFRLNFSFPSFEDIDIGINNLGKILRDSIY